MRIWIPSNPWRRLSEGIAHSTLFRLLNFFLVGMVACLMSPIIGNGAEKTKQADESVTAGGTNFGPLFPESKSSIRPNFTGFMGHDIDLVRQVVASPESLVTRENRIKKSLGELQRRSDAARTSSNAMSKLVDLIEEQAIALELRNLESSKEQVIPNLEFDTRTLLRYQSRLTYDLVLNNKNHLELEKWKSTLVISRMRMGDSSVRDDALAMINHSNIDIARTIRTLGMATDILAGKTSSSFGSPETLAENSENPYDKMSLTGLVGLSKASEGKNTEAAKSFQSALAIAMQPETFASLPKANKMVPFFARNLVDAMTHSGQEFQPWVQDTLLRAGQEKLVTQYLEKLALASLPMNPTGAIKYYIDLLQTKLLAKDDNKKIEQRIFEIAIAASEPVLLEAAWKRLVKTAALKSGDFESQARRSLEFLAFTYRKNPTNENARRLSDINDILATKFTSVPNNIEYLLLILKALHETGHHQEVVRRSGTMLQNTTKDWLLGKIFKFNLDSRAMLVGLPVNSCEANESELSSRNKEIDEYLVVLDRFIRIAEKPERSVLLVRSAHALTLRGQFEKAIDRFEEGFSDSIDSEFTKSCAAFLVRKIESTGNSVMLEKFNRILMSKSIVPDGMSPENLRQSTAEAIFKNGNTLLARGNYELAAEKFFSITKGFKSSPLFRPSLERLGFAYSKAKIMDKAIAAYGKCLELETDPNKRRELTWTIAELNASAKEYDSAGRLFRKFRTDHPAEGLKRKAASFAARNFRFAGKFEDALSEYSLHVQQVQGPKEKLDAYWEIQETGVEAKNLKVQTEALTQIAKLEKDKSKLTKTYYLLMTTFNLSGQPSLARLNAEKIISTNDQSDESLVFIAEAKYYLGLLDLAEWRSRRQTMPSEPRAFIKSLAEKFENLRNLLLSPCDNPPAKGCSQGLLEAAKTGKQFHDLVFQLEIPKYYPKETVEELETYRSLVTDKLKIETVTALQKIVDREKKSKELTQLQAQEVQNLLSETKEVLDSPLEY